MYPVVTLCTGFRNINTCLEWNERQVVSLSTWWSLYTMFSRCQSHLRVPGVMAELVAPPLGQQTQEVFALKIDQHPSKLPEQSSHSPE